MTGRSLPPRTPRPEFLALKEFGTLRYGVHEDEWWPLVQAIVASDWSLADEEVDLLLGTFDPEGHDLYGAAFVFMELIEKSPGFPQNVRRACLSSSNFWWSVLNARAGMD